MRKRRKTRKRNHDAKLIALIIPSEITHKLIKLKRCGEIVKLYL